MARNRRWMFFTLGLAAIALGLVASRAEAASCTFGVDCYCDRVKSTSNSLYDSKLLFCEDWEDPKLYDDSGVGTGSWWDHGTFRRGTNSKWRQKYGPAVHECNFSNGQPASPKRGITCDNPGLSCGVGEYASSAQGKGTADLWDANSFACVDVQRAGDVAAETAGLSLDRDPFDGKAHFAYRVTPNKPAGIVGQGNFPRAVTELGMTMAVAYPSNLAQAAGAAVWDGDFITEVDPWKHEEYGNRAIHLFMGNIGKGVGCPFCPAIAHKTGSPAGCQAILNQAQVLVGSASCNDTQLEIGSSFDRSTEWPLGHWGCAQGWIRGMGTTSGELKIWFNDRLIFHIANVNWRDLLQDQNLSFFFWNTYYNGNAGLPGAVRATSTIFRYNDNVHYREGTPVSCTQIGFNTGNPPPSPLGAPGKPTLVP